MIFDIKEYEHFIKNGDWYGYRDKVCEKQEQVISDITENNVLLKTMITLEKSDYILYKFMGKTAACLIFCLGGIINLFFNYYDESKVWFAHFYYFFLAYYVLFHITKNDFKLNNFYTICLFFPYGIYLVLKHTYICLILTSVNANNIIRFFKISYPTISKNINFDKLYSYIYYKLTENLQANIYELVIIEVLYVSLYFLISNQCGRINIFRKNIYKNECFVYKLQMYNMSIMYILMLSFANINEIELWKIWVVRNFYHISISVFVKLFFNNK